MTRTYVLLTVAGALVGLTINSGLAATLTVTTTADSGAGSLRQAILDANAHTFPERVRKHNQHGLVIAERLRGHPNVERVWYPKWENREAYEAVRRADGGYGSLLAFLPKEAEVRAARVYDALTVCKGPSLGTVFTLACPFTLLAHYNELEWAESCGVSRYLIRISVGLEDPDELWRRFEAALSVA